MVLFSTQSYHYLRDAICAVKHFEHGQLESKTFKDDEFEVSHFKMFDSKESYKRYLGECRQHLAAKAKKRNVASPRGPALPAPVVTPAPAPAPAPVEFKPVDHSGDVPPATEVHGTIGE